jgi:glycosyltransferase involved in cell wall biosynthesis
LRWGSEYYAHQLARGLRERGHEVFVLHPMHDGSRPRYTMEEVASDGFRVFQFHSRGDPRKPLSDSYENTHLERVFDGLLEVLRPDVVHFMYLLWGLSAGMPSACRRRAIPTALTLTDLGLLCHRGQMFDWRLQACGGPHPARVCARCIREPAPFDSTRSGVWVKRWAVRCLAALGGLGRVVTTADVERREQHMRRCWDAVDRLIAPTRVFEEMFRAQGIPAHKLTRLVYAIDEHAFVRARARPPSGRIRLGFMGQFAPHKGPDTLLAAIRIMDARLPESVEPWEVFFYGAGPPGRHRFFPERMLAAAPSPRVFFCSAFDSFDLPQVLAGLHAVVLPSRWIENAPLTILQARAAGIPVIASDVAGIREVLEPGVHGLLVPPDDPLALADALREVILGKWDRRPDPDLPLDFGAHLDGVEGIYDGLLAGTGSVASHP